MIRRSHRRVPLPALASAAPRGAVLLGIVLAALGSPACRRKEPARAAAEVRSEQPEPGLDGPCVPTGPELCFNGLDDNCNGLLDEGCGVRSGLIQFVAAWVEQDVDVDLHVTDPNGEVAEVGHVSESGLTKLHDCPGKQNLCYGQNYESVHLEGDDPRPGSYRVGVRLDALGSAEPPIVVRVGARIGGTSHNAVVRLQHEGDEESLTFRLREVSGGGGSELPSAQRGTGTR